MSEREMKVTLDATNGWTDQGTLQKGFSSSRQSKPRSTSKVRLRRDPAG